MAKIRVHEIAKEYNVPAKDVMTFLEGHNIEVSSHMSTLEDNAVALVRGKYGKSGEADADKKERPKKKSSISAVYNPQNSKMSNRRSNNGNRNGDRPQRQNGDRPQRANGENRQRQDGDRPRYDNRQRQNGDRPQRQNGDRPRYDGDRSQRPNGDRPARNGDRPQRRYGDRPARQENGDRNGRYERKDNNNQKGFQGNRGGGNNFGGNRNNRQDNSGRSRESRGRLDHDISRMNRDNKASIEELRGKENTHVNKKKNKQDYERKNRKQEQYVNLEKKTGHKKRNAQPQPQAEKKTDEVRSISLPEVMTVRELAERIDVPASKVVEKLFMQGILATVNQEVDYEKAEEIALEFNCIAEPEEKVDVIAELLKEEEEDENTLVSRPPVVCVMGHVDHGKTSLLDAIRETHVTDREAGGITQHIGASVVQINGQKITFLDTPGHEAFTAMRMRGANSTDIAILVVAADDGIMPQTIEAISHAKAAGIEIIVAINKIDKESANIDYVKQGLAEQGLIPEDWGGSTICVPVSARTGEGITELLEMVLLTADILELKANPKRKARGLVIEAQLDKGRGAVATILVQKGTLKVGEPIAAGSSYGKVRAMIDDKGRRVKEAGPSTPVEILGLNSVPNAGEVFVACDSDKDARSFADTFVSQNREKMLEETRSRMSLDDLFSQIQTGNLKELELIVKADVQGSVEAVKQSLTKLSNEEVVVKVIHGGVGAINESDVSLASASNAIIIGFNVKPDATAKATAEQEHVDIRLYSVIYKAIEDIEAAMKGMLDPIFEEKVIGHAEVRQIFKASGVGNIAGSYILDGVFERNCKVRITREGKQIFEGDLASLKRFKDDVKEVKAGYECGLVFEGFNDIAEFDVVEAYKMVEVPR
ncbi:translation initiation factor IF-2 [Eubacterium ramulus]|uniref:translation initiation factor IF-2 n=1 Tax=Eubacterium ramulus TaxID=39490 RepID=UPI0026EAD4E5|nr:translation initiation factor IF-2 [Eubacterium ramulus]